MRNCDDCSEPPDATFSLKQTLLSLNGLFSKKSSFETITNLLYKILNSIIIALCAYDII